MSSTMDSTAMDKFVRKKVISSDSLGSLTSLHAAFRKQLEQHPNDTEFLVDLEDQMITCTEEGCWADCKFEFDSTGAIDFGPFRQHIIDSKYSQEHALRRDARLRKARRELLAQRAPVMQPETKPTPRALSASTSSSDVKPSIGSQPPRVPTPSTSAVGTFSATAKREPSNFNLAPASPTKKFKIASTGDPTVKSDLARGVVPPALPTAESQRELAAIVQRQQLAQRSLDAHLRKPPQYRNMQWEMQKLNLERSLDQAHADRDLHRQSLINSGAPGAARQAVAGPGPGTIALARTNPGAYANLQAYHESEQARRAAEAAAAAQARLAAAQYGPPQPYLNRLVHGALGVGNALADGVRAVFDNFPGLGPAAGEDGWEEPFHRAYGGRQPRGVVHSADMDDFFKKTAEEEMFEDNVTVDEAAKKLGLSSQQDVIENCRVHLMPHQLIGVAWMLEKEKGDTYGGILGDEMGLGKTIQMIALMALNESTDPKEKTTLVVAPLSLLRQWEREIEDKMVPDHWSVLIYHGSDDRKKDIRRVRDLRKYDVVLTTYGTLVMEFEDEEDIYTKAKRAANKAGRENDVEEFIKHTREPGLLTKMNWYRVVLDEAHSIRNRSTKSSRAVKELDSLYRWALTGTLIVNKHEDVFPLLRFLQLKPWFEWTEFKINVVPPKNARPAQLDASSKRLNLILKRIHMRRKKDSKLDGKPLLQLPPKNVELRELEFSLEERNTYSEVEAKAQVRFNKYLKAGTVLKNYAQVLALLLRLRQICFHPALIVAEFDPDHEEKFKKASLERALELLGEDGVAKLKQRQLTKSLERIKAEQEGDADASADSEDCPICFEAAAATEGGALITRCGHVFCKGCLDEVMAQIADDDDDNTPGPKLKRGQTHCPSCRGGISPEEVFALAAFEPDQGQVERTKKTKSKPPTTDEDDEDEDESESEPATDDDDDTLDGFVVPDGEGESEEDSDDDVKVKKRSRAKGKGKSKQPNKRPKRVIDDSEDEFEDEIDELESSSSEEEFEPVKKQPKRKRDTRTKQDKARDKRKAQKAAKKWRSEQEPSTKMRWCLAEIERLENEFPDDKIIIISQWTSVLDMMETYLGNNGHKSTRYQGDMNAVDRDKSLQDFMTKESRKIMLLSLKCGGVGLNLVRANRVISLDLAWSPAVEAQAFDRVHRIGQLKDVQVDRLTIGTTVEQRIGELQAKKQSIADGSLGEGSGKKMGKLSVGEIAGLFGLKENGERL